MDDEIKTALRFLQNTAQRFGYVLNPDENALHRIVGYMADNKLKHGEYFCPCKQHYPVDTESDPVCPCSAFRDEIVRDGHCECHVFFDEVAAVQAKRRPGLLATITCPG